MQTKSGEQDGSRPNKCVGGGSEMLQGLYALTTHLSPLRPADPILWVGGVFAAFLLATSSANPDDSKGRGFHVDPGGLADSGQHVVESAQHLGTTIAILPDRTTGRDWGLKYLQEAVDDLNRISPDAVFCVGDLVQGYTRDPAQWDREAKDYLTIVEGLTARYFPTAGNHDVISGHRDSDDRSFEERFRHRFGPLYYSVQLPDLTVLVLFSDEALDDRAVTLGDTQLSWIQGALEQAHARGKPIILLMHRPLWRYEKVDWGSRVQPLLEAAGVDAVIAGHYHALQRDTDVSGIQYHILGTCGGAIDQHPLAGQLQHLTFLRTATDGGIRIHHMAVGATLPDDFIIRADQERTFALKSARKVLDVLGTVPDPYLAKSPVKGQLTLKLQNPTDVPVEFSAHPAWKPRAQSVTGEPWVSDVEADTFNKWTVNLDGPWIVAATPVVTLPAGGAGTLTLEVTASPSATPPPPGEFRVVAKFVDSKGRTVPVVLPRRLPIDRVIEPAASETQSPDWPISAYDASPFETLEADPTVRIWRTGSEVLMRFSVPDNTIASMGTEERKTAEVIRNPMFDSIRLRWRSTDGNRLTESIVDPRPDASRIGPLHVRDYELTKSGYSALLALPLAIWDEATWLELGVADNDDTYHTQWRTSVAKDAQKHP